MTINQLPLWMEVPVTPAPRRLQGLSRKQRSIVSYLAQNGTITLAQAVALIGGDIYTNEEKHVGALLSNMVRRQFIVRVKPGLFKLP